MFPSLSQPTAFVTTNHKDLAHCWLILSNQCACYKRVNLRTSSSLNHKKWEILAKEIEMDEVYYFLMVLLAHPDRP